MCRPAWWYSFDFVGLTLVSLWLAGDCARINSLNANVQKAEDSTHSNFTQEFELHRASLKGQLFRERYRLEEFLHSSGPGPGHWPDIKGYNVRSYKQDHINAGSFGDVWKAQDSATGKSVAIKIFYRKCDPPECLGKHEFLTWLTATRDEQQELSKNGKECQLVKDMLRSRHLYPPGASHICDCYAEHVTDGWGTANALFLVQELCGRDIQFSVIDDHTSKQPRGTPGDINKARSVTLQILQVLSFLSMFQTPIIHRDLKPENVNIVGGNVKVIDWGLTKFATTRHQSDHPGGTPGYIPPEVLTTFKAFGLPAHSFDTYSTGLIYLQLLCPDISPPGYWNYKPFVDFNKAVIVDVLRQNCPTIDLRAVDDDVRVITRMLDGLPENRQDPGGILTYASAFRAFRRKQKTIKPTTPDQGLHAVGTKVEYFSSTFGGGWIPCVVAGYATSSTYILNYHDGTSLHESADPKKVRLPGVKLDVNDKVAYKSSSQGTQCGIITHVVYDNKDKQKVVGYRLVRCEGGNLLHEQADPRKIKRWKAIVSAALALPDAQPKRLLPVPEEFAAKVNPPRQKNFEYKVGDKVIYRNQFGDYLEGVIAAVRQDHFGEKYDVPGVVMNASPVMLMRARRP